MPVRRFHRSCCILLLFVLTGCFFIGLSGCGGAASTALASQAKGVLSASVNSISFGSVPVNTKVTVSLMLRNSGPGSIQVSGLSFSSNEFSAVGQNSLPITLGAGTSYQLTIQFAPTASGAASGTLTATSSNAANSSVSVSLSGTGESASAVVPTLTVSSSSIAFGDVTVNSSATQTITLTSSGSSPVTVNSVTLSGSGFSMSGASFPLVINPQQTATLDVAFKPTAAGAATGSMVISSNSSSGSSTTVSLMGTGVAVGTGSSYKVQLTWDAPAISSDPVVGYFVYRAPSGSTNYQALNSSSELGTNFEDEAVTSGQSYDYAVRSVDAAGNLSVQSNIATVAVP